MVVTNCAVPLMQAVCNGGAEVVIVRLEEDVGVGRDILLFTLCTEGVGRVPKGLATTELVAGVVVDDDVLLVVDDMFGTEVGVLEELDMDDIVDDDGVDDIDNDDEDLEEEELPVVEDVVDALLEEVDDGVLAVDVEGELLEGLEAEEDALDDENELLVVENDGDDDEGVLLVVDVDVVVGPVWVFDVDVTNPEDEELDDDDGDVPPREDDEEVLVVESDVGVDAGPAVVDRGGVVDAELGELLNSTLIQTDTSHADETDNYVVVKRQSQADDILDRTLPGHKVVKVGAMEGVFAVNQGQKAYDGNMSNANHPPYQANPGLSVLVNM